MPNTFWNKQTKLPLKCGLKRFKDFHHSQNWWNYFDFIIFWRAVVSTGSTGSIEPVNFMARDNGTCEIGKIVKIESTNFQGR